MSHRTPLRRLLSSFAAGAGLLALPLAAGAITPTPRYAHTATLMANGNLLIAGGVNAAGTVVNTVELLATGGSIGGGDDEFVASMSVARASHTATFMPNGQVLVAGGITNAGTATNTVEIYNPITNSWSLLGATLSNSRYNHTATLLQDGRVLICGGQDQNGNVWSSCDAYNSATGVLTDNVATLNQARAIHTASLLKDGTVWFAGGWNPAAVNAGTNYYLPTTERFNPVTNTFSVDVYLLEARAYHSATVMGDGRVFVNGGYNGADYGSPTDPTDPKHNFGLLDASELFDPTSDEETPGPTMVFRRMMHGATLLAGGDLDINGGLGNISPQTTAVTLNADSGSLSTTFGGTDTFTLTNANPTLPAIQINLPTAASGTITNGYILWYGSDNTSNATVTFTSGTLYVSLSSTSLNGVVVDCVSGTCGIVNMPTSLNVTGTTLGYQQGPNGNPTVSPVALATYNGTFSSSATIVIQEMVLATGERYNESTNSSAIAYQAYAGRYQHTSTLSTSGDVDYVGGEGVSGALEDPAGDRLDDAVVLHDGNFNTVSATMSTARAYHTATLLTDGTILVAGGESASTNAQLATAQIYSPTLGSFNQTAGVMSLSRSNHTATLMTNGRVLISGGFTNQVSTQPTNVAEIYYPNTQLFELTGPMNYARADHTATLMPDGSVIVIGGQTNSQGLLNAVEQYQPVTGVWTTLAAMPTALANQTATLLKDGRLLVIGGRTAASNPSVGVYAYSEGTNTWATLTSMPIGLYDHTATLMFDGRVLVAGGNDGLGSYGGSFLFNPNAGAGGTWTAAGALTQARSGHSATLLPNGTVMISGGIGNPAPTYVETYHIDHSTWAPIGTFPTARAAHTMTLGLDNNVYGIGGYSGSTYFNSAVVKNFTSSPDVDTLGAPPSLRQSSVTAISAYPFTAGSNLTVTGTSFEGATEASGGGAASMNSSFSFPHLVLQQFGTSGGSSSQSDPGFAVDLTTQIYLNSGNASTLNTSLTVATPASPQMPYGWYVARTGANDIYSKGSIFQVGPALPTVAPGAISGTALGTSSISWNWGAVAGSGYDVYQATSSVFLGTTSANSFVQTGLQPNTTGSIIVSAFNLSGDGPLTYSTTFFTLAAAPTLVQLSSVTPNSVLVQWNINNNAPGAVYEISQSTDDFVTSFSTPVPASLQVTTNSATVSALLPSTTYYFRLRAFNAQNLPSGFSAIVSTETTSAVGGVTGVALSPTSIQWSWTATAGATQYDIFVATTGQLDGTSTTTIFTDNNLGVDTARQILVGAVTGAGLGPLAASTTIYTLANEPGPVSPAYVSLSTGGFVVNWANNGNPPNIEYDAAISVIVRSNGVDTLTVSTVSTFNLSAGVTGLNPSRYAQATIYAVNGNGILSAPYVIASTATLANPPDSLVITANTANSISVAWDNNSNSTSTFYQVTYSTDDFVTNVATAVTFANGADLSTATIAGLLTSTTYWIVVQAENKQGDLTSFSNTVSTITSNGGAPPGLLQGVLPAATTGQISGDLGNGEYVTLNSPAGAFSNNTTVLISSYNVPGPLCPGAVNIGVQMTATPSVLPMRGLTLILAYTLAELGTVAPGEATILRYVPSEGVCVPLNTTVNTTALTLSAEINDFGLFVVAAPPLFGSADSARAYPNPYHVNRDGYVTIDQIPAGSRVRILDLRGDVVLDQAANQSGLVTWSATNGSGRNVASGLYLVIVEGGGAKKIMKLAVIR